MPGIILIADAHHDSRAILVSFLGFHGYTVVEAATGKDALRMARDHNPAVILTELFLPQLDGFGLLQAVREDPSLRHVPVLVITADALPEARERAVAGGCDHFLLKPFDPRNLLELLVQLLQREESATVPGGGRISASLSWGGAGGEGPPADPLGLLLG